MTTPITHPCPHCGKDYDISHRLNGDRVWCPCGGWSLVVMYPDGRTRLVKSLALEPARETTADAALVAEMSALRAELEAVRARGQQSVQRWHEAAEVEHAARVELETALRFVFERIEDNAVAYERDPNERGWRATFSYEEVSELRALIDPDYAQQVQNERG